MKTKRSTFVINFVIVVTISLVQISFGLVLRVPQDFTTITQAVLAIPDSDTVIVSPGTYYEQIDVSNRSFTLAGAFLFSQDTNDIRNVILTLPDSIRLSTSQRRSVLIFDNCNHINLIGFTVRGGLGTLYSLNFSNPQYYIYGGNVLTDSTNICYSHMRIISGLANNGGGLSSNYGNIILQNSTIDSCQGFGIGCVGGGAFFYGDTVIVSNNKISNNNHDWGVGGVHYFSNYSEVYSNIMLNNSSPFASSVLGYNAVIVNGNTIFHNSSNSFTMWFINLNRGRNQVNSIVDNLFYSNTIYRSNSPPGGNCLYLQNTDSTNWLIQYNYFTDNINDTLPNGSSISVQHGYATIKNNYFYNNRSVHSSVLAIRANARITFDSNIVYNNGANRIISVISNSRISASNNDFVSNSGAIFHIEPTGSHGYLYNNYWGHPSGPRAPGNPNGQGDSIGYWYNNNYEYIPFRTTPVFPELDIKDFGDGSGQYGSGLPNSVTIEKVYPNPTNSTLTVNYTIARPQLISIRLYDTNGREVYASLPQLQVAGSHNFSLQTDGVASGLYFLKLSSPTSPTESAMQKVVLLK